MTSHHIVPRKLGKHAEAKLFLAHKDLPIKESSLIEAFEVTGIDRNGKRFKKVFPPNSAGYIQMTGTNIWRGTKWVRLSENRRVIWTQIYN